MRTVALFSALLLFAGCHIEEPTWGEPYDPPADEFCGFDTAGACFNHSDCTRGGCSGEVCQSALEEPVYTNCQAQVCKQADDYRLSCGCVANQCVWF